MRKFTDYELTKNDAEWLRCFFMPRDMRIEYLTKFRDGRTPEQLIEKLADLMGLMNSITENTRSFIESYLVAECGHSPETAARLNLPDMVGALAGAGIAVDPTAAMCGTCAFRIGSEANQCFSTVIDAKDCLHDGDRFNCHERKDVRGKLTLRCAGFMEARKARA